MIGIALTAQVTAPASPSVQRSQELSATVGRLEKENSQLSSRVEDLSEQIRRYELSQHDTDEMAREIASSLETARMEAGLVALAGPGIVVEVDDLRVDSTGQIVRAVHDEDLLLIVNELNAAGAEAISINDERLISISEIRLAGTRININTRAQAAPYTIRAIGNPDTLLAAMNLYGGVLETFSQIASIRSYPAERLDIPAYSGIAAYEWARAAE